MTQETILNFYNNPGPMTSGGKYAAILESLPNEIAALCRIVQGLAIHEYVASSFYGLTIPEDRKEMLPWDVWGAMPRANERLSDEQLPFFDQLAAMTREPDASFEELRRIYESNDRLLVPSTVFNAVLNRPEKI